MTELTILAQSVNGYFRCLAMNKAGSDSDVKRVMIIPPEGKFIKITIDVLFLLLNNNIIIKQLKFFTKFNIIKYLIRKNVCGNK